jgi:multiple sugar transport system ATP-binding protein
MPGHAAREIRERVTETARLLRIEHLLSSKTSKLSGGDRQRVALGRAMVRRPKAFLMDEPLGALDAEFRQLMCGELRELHDRISATTVYVTHDQHEAMSMADRIAVMNAGRVEQIGTPQEIYDRPASMFVADFIGSPPMNFLHFEAAFDRATGHQIPRRQHCRAGDPRGACRGTAGAGRASGAHPFLGRSAGARPRLRRRVSRHDADRHRRNRAGARQGAAAVERAGAGRRDRWAGIPVRSLALFDAQTGSAIRTASHGASAMANVALRHVSKRFGRIEAVRDLSLVINDGEFVVLLGPSGAGKTTTLRLITGLEHPDQGSISINGRDVTRDPPGTRDIAFVFQQYSLYPHLTVYDNLAFPLRSPAHAHSRSRPSASASSRRRSSCTSPASLATGRRGLSGGEMQRVAIGRALVRDPVRSI